MFKLILAVVFVVGAVSCDTKPTQEKPVDPAEYKTPLMNANKELVKTEDENIENYINRKGWSMIETGSGLRYLIYKAGSGKRVEEELVLRYNYEVSLLTGKVCYTSEKDGYGEFLVGKGGVESGLEEAVLHLREGDRAKIILPSHLAFGLMGDDDCVPKKATIVYDLEVLAVLDPFKKN